MPNPSNTTRRAEARNLERLNSSLPQYPAPVQALKAQTLPSSLQLQQQQRSRSSEVHQLNLLALLEKSKEQALSLEAVPIDLTVGVGERFWLIHQESGLRVPGQFNAAEVEHILKATEQWDWEIDLKTREPACRYRFLWLLESICKPKEVLGVAA